MPKPTPQPQHPGTMPKFKHSGATGDIVFSLPAIRAKGGGVLYITMEHKQRAQSIAKLIRTQPYIYGCFVVDKAPDDCIDLDRFRLFAGHHNNLIGAHYRALALPFTPEAFDPWIHVPKIAEPPTWDGSYSVINYTTNYMDPAFDWKAEVDYLLTISDRVLFVGYRAEYDLFQERFNIPAVFHDCDFEGAATLIKYATMFTGGYSAMATIAQGIGNPMRLVQAPGHTCSTLFVDRETVVNL
jgi:hypothetical protein